MFVFTIVDGCKITKNILYKQTKTTKIMKKINFSDYFHQTIVESLTHDAYCRVVSLLSDGESPKYLFEVFFKFTHVYKFIVYDDAESAINLYNEIVK